MRDLDITGVVQGKTRITTRSDSSSTKPLDLVNREFIVTRLNRLWISDITYVASWHGFAYTALVIDVFACVIVGWRVSSSMTTDLSLDALEQALHDRQVANRWYITATTYCNTCLFDTRSDSPKSALRRLLEGAVIHTTTQWLNHFLDCTTWR